MDFRKLCEDYGIPIAPQTHKHWRAGWVNVECPFCTGNPGYHLGYEESGEGSGFSCYRCGGKGVVRTISALLRVSYGQARDIVEEYGGRPFAVRKRRWAQWKLKDAERPLGVGRLRALGQKYLTSRGFDAEAIERLWDVSEIGPVGRHKFRLFIPIKFQGYAVSWTCRSIVGSDVRYLSCPTEKEMVPHKQILYGIDEVPSRNRLVVVEGCTDVWRLGPGSVATFGTKFTQSQLKLMSSFARIVLIRDSDSAGRMAWDKLAMQLEGLGLPVLVHSLDGAEDAAALPQDEATYLMKTI